MCRIVSMLAGLHKKYFAALLILTSMGCAHAERQIVPPGSEAIIVDGNARIVFLHDGSAYYQRESWETISLCGGGCLSCDRRDFEKQVYLQNALAKSKRVLVNEAIDETEDKSKYTGCRAYLFDAKSRLLIEHNIDTSFCTYLLNDRVRYR